MRGFPLLSTLLIAAGFALAWWPLQRSIEVADAASNPGTELAKSTASTPASGAKVEVGANRDVCEVRLYASSPWQSLRVESLGKAIIEDTDGSSISVAVLALPSDPQGFDFWIEASFTDDTERVAVGIEIENSFGDVIQRTLWSEDGAIADSVFFQAESE